MRVLLASAIVTALLAAACGSASSPTAPGPGPAATGGGSAPLTGTWAGTAFDSTGSMMGAGMSAAMFDNMTWNIVQTGNTFTGTMQFPGYMARGPMTISGTINGSTATFTMTMPAGSMMSSVTCTATSTGTFDFAAVMTQIHGQYAGTNSCTGPFNQGQINLSRR
jgi:hypothetical protein